MEKSKLAPINREQKKLMVEYVQKYPNLAKQKFSQSFNFKKAQQHWEELSQILNSVPGGSKKNWIQWRKTWTDIKKNAKSKAGDLQRYIQGTGGGPAVPKEKNVTDLEKDILDIIGNVMQRGHENITETPVEIDFVDFDEHIGGNTFEIAEPVTLDKHVDADTYLNPIAGPSAASSDLSNTNVVLTPSSKKVSDHSYSVESTKDLLGSSGKGKRLSATRRLENSQKLSAEMLKSIDSRTLMMEEYYRSKIEYFNHMRNYHEKKLQLQQNINELLQETLIEARHIKISLNGGEYRNGNE